MKTSLRPRLLGALLLMLLGLANFAVACGSGPHLHTKFTEGMQIVPQSDLSHHLVLAADFGFFIVAMFFLASILRRSEPVKFAERF